MAVLEAERIVEHFNQSGLSVTSSEKDDWAIPGALVAKAVSKNGRRYSEQAMRDIARLIEGNPLSIEHEDEDRIDQGLPGRLFLERIGGFKNGRCVEGKVLADMHIDEFHRHAESFRNQCRKFPNNVNLSIEFDRNMCEAETSDDGILEINRVNELLDTCIVARGGTTTTLYESHQRTKMSESKTSEADLERIVESITAKAEDKRKITEELSSLRGKITERDTKITKLLDRVTEFENADKQRESIKDIREEAKKLEYQIADDEAESLVGLPAQRITERLALWSKKSSNKKQDGEEQWSHSKSSTDGQKSAEPKPYAWMDN